MANIYDQFDESAQAGNPYDQFDQTPAARPEPTITGSYVPYVTDTGVQAPTPRIGFGPGAGQVGTAPPEAVQAASIGAAGARTPEKAPEYAHTTGQAMKEGVATAALLPVGGEAFQAPTLAGRIIKGLGAGGGGSFLYGTATGEGNIEQHLAHGAEMATWGAGIGAVFPPLSKVLGAGGHLALDRLSSWFGGKQSRIGTAARMIAERILKSNPGISPEEALQRTKEELMGLGEAGALGDVSDELQNLTGAVARAGGEPGQTIRNRLRVRQEGTRNPDTMELQGGQVGRTEAMLQGLSPENPRLLGGELAGQDATTHQFYREAFAANQNVDSPVIRRLVKTPEGKRALGEAVKAMRNEVDTSGAGKLVSRPDPELTAIYNELLDLEKIAGKKTGAGVGRGFKLETLDLLKRELDRIGQLAETGATDTVRARGRRAKVLAKRLRNELDRLDETAKAGPNSFKAEGGEYAKARARAQQRIEARKALQSGEHFLLKSKFRNEDELRAALNEMDPEQRHAFRVNAAQTLKDMAAGTKATHDVTKKLKGDRLLESKIKLAFGDSETFKTYMRFMNAEERMFKTYAKVFRGSETAERLGEDARLNAGPLVAEGAGVVGSAARGNKVDALVRAGRLAMRVLGDVGTRARMPENIRRELADFLTGPEGLAQFEGQIGRQTRVKELSKEARAWLARALLTAEARNHERTQ